MRHPYDMVAGQLRLMGARVSPTPDGGAAEFADVARYHTAAEWADRRGRVDVTPTTRCHSFAVEGRGWRILVYCVEARS